MWEKNIRCPNCGYEGKSKRLGPPLFKNLIFMVLAFVFAWTIIAPLMYLAWVIRNFSNHTCPKCEYENVVVE